MTSPSCGLPAMRMRIKAWLLRKLLDLKADSDVAIVSVLGHEPVITHGSWYRKPIPWTSPDVVSNWNPRGIIH